MRWVSRAMSCAVLPTCLPVYRYTVDAVFNFAKLQSWLEGVAATYATEGRMWKRYTPKEEHQRGRFTDEGEAIGAYYGLSQEALQFYHVHSDANDEHGDINEAILKQYCVTRGTPGKGFGCGALSLGESGDPPRYYLPVLRRG